MKYKVIETSKEPLKHFDKLNSKTKYKLLTPEEAKEKAMFSRGSSNVTFGYDSFMYNSIKGVLPYVTLELNSCRERWTIHGNDSYVISVDMVEPYRKEIKYNKDLL